MHAQNDRPGLGPVTPDRNIEAEGSTSIGSERREKWRSVDVRSMIGDLL